MHGFQFGINVYKYSAASIGYGYFYQLGNGKHMQILHKSTISTEVQLGKPLLYAPKISHSFMLVTGSMGIVLGAEYIYYTDLEKHNQVIRSQLGYVLPRYTIELLYGYNITIDNKSPQLKYNTHNISLIFWPFKDTRKKANCNCDTNGKKI